MLNESEHMDSQQQPKVVNIGYQQEQLTTLTLATTALNQSLSEIKLSQPHSIA